jgi:GH35 family endo-1,4-beta-xylanase
MTRDDSIRFRYDLPNVPRGWRYVSDDEGQPFSWATSHNEAALSFELPRVRCRLSVLVSRGSTPPVWLTADNGGDGYGPGAAGSYGLAAELIRSKLAAMRSLTHRFHRSGFHPQTALATQVATALREAEEALATHAEGPRALHVLLNLVDACDALVLAHAQAQPINHEQAIGCDVSRMYGSKPDRFRHYMRRLCNYATVTFYTMSTGFEDFEPVEGAYEFGIRDLLVDHVKRAGMTVEGRPLLWLHPWVTPPWLARKSVREVKAYLRAFIPSTVGHYAGRLHCWEVVNEAHDWADVLHLTHGELIDLTGYACKLAREADPNAQLLINTTDPFGMYASSGTRADGSRVQGRQWTPYTYFRDLIQAGVDFDLAGIQIYRPYQDLADTVAMVERFEKLGKPVFITEIGAPSRSDRLRPPVDGEPPDLVHRWTLSQQATWAEQMYTLLMSRTKVVGIAWYDFVDHRPFLPGGGLLDRDCHPKPAYQRLERLLVKSGRIPDVPPPAITET